MKTKHLKFIDFDKVDTLLEGFNKATGFGTAILDLEGNVLSKSGWRKICTDFHRINPETAKNCTISDTELAGKLSAGEKFHSYKCLNGLVDVAVPIVIKGEHVANLFTGQFFFEKPDRFLFKKQAEIYGFDEKKYLEAVEEVPVFSREKVKAASDFLLNMTLLISEMTLQKMEQTELNKALKESDEKMRSIYCAVPAGIGVVANRLLKEVNPRICEMTGYTREELVEKNARMLYPSREEYEFVGKEKYDQIKVAGTGEVETRWKKKDGSIINVLLASTPIDIDDHSKGITFSALDITSRKQAEEENRVLADIVRKSRDFIGVADPEGKAFFVNPAGKAMVGLDEENEETRTVVENYFFPEDIEFVKNEIIPTVMKLGRWAGEFRFRHFKTGEPVYVYYDLFLTLDPSTGKVQNLTTLTRDITERKQVEEALRESEEFNRKLLATIPDLVVRTDIDGNIIFVNDTGLKQFPDLSKEDLIGKNMLSFVNQKDIERAETNSRLMFEKSLGVREYTFVLGDNIELVCEVNGDAVRDAENNPIGMVYVIRDVTERIRNESALKERESQLQKIFDILPVGLWFADKEGTLKSGNPAGIKIWGAEPKVPISEYGVFKARHMPSGEEIKPHEWALAKTISEGATITDELLEIDAFDGKKKVILNYTAPVNDDEGKLLGAIVVNLDVTEREKAEQKRRLSEERLSSLIEAIPDAIFFKDGEGRWLITNKTAKDLFNLHGFDWYGKTDAQLAKERPEFAEAHKGCIAGDKMAWDKGNLIIDNETLTDDDGNIQYFEVRKMPLYDDDGTPKALVVIGENITERKQSEMELKERMQELERFQRITVGREHKMLELKKEVNELLEKLGHEPKYRIVSEE